MDIQNYFSTTVNSLLDTQIVKLANNAISFSEVDPLPFKNLKTTPKFRFQFNLQNPDDSSKDQH